MGDIADAIIEGLLCQSCGMYIDSDSDGVPRYCDECAGDAADDWNDIDHD